MNIPVSWLRELANVDNKESTAVVIEKMTDAGNAVETVTRIGEEISNVVVGKITLLERHPDADKLWVTNADVGSGEPLQIITGADNLTVGDYIPVALHGATLVDGLKIKKGKMRGLESNGMLCSIGELGFTIEDLPDATEDGIYVFPKAIWADLKLGECIKPLMGLDEEIADFDILANRPDTNSAIGLAREVAAVYNQPFALPEITVKETGGKADAHRQSITAADLVSVEIKDPNRCRRFIARVVENVKVGPSPAWMRQRLTMCGIRPINNIVDITNYVMLEYGQPLHAFDISAVAKDEANGGKHHIIVRLSNSGEKFTTLDGVERALPDHTILVADHTKPIGIAGIMGGENSMITESSHTILFESANFDAVSIRHTARSLGMRTDASARFEKGQDPNQPEISINRAMQLIEELACGDVVPGAVDAYPNRREPKIVTFTPSDINKLLGISAEKLDVEAIRSYLRRVGIKTREAAEQNRFIPKEQSSANDGGVMLEALIPTFRADITCTADLAEEVVRFYGLNNIQPTYTQILAGVGTAGYRSGKTPERRRIDAIKQTAVSLGYSEALTYPFESPKVLDKLLIPANHPARQAVTLKNPLGEDFSQLRTLPLGGLLESLSRNHNKGNQDAALFEIANIFGRDKTQEPSSPDECIEDSEIDFFEVTYLTFAAYGTSVDFLSTKGDVETLVSTFTARPLIFTKKDISQGKISVGATPIPYLHPGRSAGISIKLTQNPRDPEILLGYIGEIHPLVAKNYHLNTKAYIAVLHIDTLHCIAEGATFKYTAPSIYPPLDRDLAFKVKKEITAAQLESAIKEKGGQLLSEVKLFDVYEGKQIEAGYKSVAYALRFRTNDRTLTVEEVQKPIAAILENLEKKLGAEVRK